MSAMDDQARAWATEVCELVRDAAATELAAGSAELVRAADPDTGWDRIDLFPSSHGAARLSLFPGDGDAGVDDVEIGEHGSAELWQTRAERLDIVRLLVRAVVAGDYSEIVVYARDGRVARVTAVVSTDERTWTYDRRMGVRAWRGRQETQQYSPY